MNLEVFIGPLIAAAVVIGTGLVAHAVHDAYKQGRMERDIEQLRDQIGKDGQTGMRGDVHRHGNVITWLGGCLWMVANKVGIELPKREK